MKKAENKKEKIEEQKVEKTEAKAEVKEEQKTEAPQEPLTKKEKWKKELWQSFKYFLFSTSAGIVQLVSFTILNEWVIRDVNMEYGWSYFIALALSVLWNFTFNRKFTFKDAGNVPIAMLKVLGYYLVFTPLSIWWGEALATIWNEYLVLAFTMVINFLTEFTFMKFVVFRKPKQKAPATAPTENVATAENTEAAKVEETEPEAKKETAKKAKTKKTESK